MVNRLRCWLGRPKIRRQMMGGIDFALCEYCRRQVEVHDETRVQMLFGYKW